MLSAVYFHINQPSANVGSGDSFLDALPAMIAVVLLMGMFFAAMFAIVTDIRGVKYYSIAFAIWFLWPLYIPVVIYAMIMTILRPERKP